MQVAVLTMKPMNEKESAQGPYFIIMAENAAQKWSIVALHKFKNIFQLFQKLYNIAGQSGESLYVLCID